MIDLTLQQLALRIVAFVFVATVHGVTVAAVAVALGDQGPRHDGRRSINPLAHLDIVGTVSGVLWPAGWIRPIAIDPCALRTGRIGLVIVVAAGFAATVTSALALRLARPFVLPLLPDTASATVFAVIELIVGYSAVFALVNVLPLPPLTGGHLLVAAAPAYRKVLARIAPYAGVVLAVAAWWGLVKPIWVAAYEILAPAMLGHSVSMFGHPLRF
jgi:Zn-dependent protease